MQVIGCSGGKLQRFSGCITCLQPQCFGIVCLQVDGKAHFAVGKHRDERFIIHVFVIAAVHTDAVHTKLADALGGRRVVDKQHNAVESDHRRIVIDVFHSKFKDIAVLRIDAVRSAVLDDEDLELPLGGSCDLPRAELVELPDRQIGVAQVIACIQPPTAVCACNDDVGDREFSAALCVQQIHSEAETNIVCDHLRQVGRVEIGFDDGGREQFGVEEQRPLHVRLRRLREVDAEVPFPFCFLRESLCLYKNDKFFRSFGDLIGISVALGGEEFAVHSYANDLDIVAACNGEGQCFACAVDVSEPLHGRAAIFDLGQIQPVEKSADDTDIEPRSIFGDDIGIGSVRPLDLFSVDGDLLCFEQGIGDGHGEAYAVAYRIVIVFDLDRGVFGRHLRLEADGTVDKGSDQFALRHLRSIVGIDACAAHAEFSCALSVGIVHEQVDRAEGDHARIIICIDGGKIVCRTVLRIQAVLSPFFDDEHLKVSCRNGCDLLLVEAVFIALPAAQVVSDVEIPAARRLADDDVRNGKCAAAVFIFEVDAETEAHAVTAICDPGCVEAAFNDRGCDIALAMIFVVIQLTRRVGDLRLLEALDEVLFPRQNIGGEGIGHVDVQHTICCKVSVQFRKDKTVFFGKYGGIFPFGDVCKIAALFVDGTLIDCAAAVHDQGKACSLFCREFLSEQRQLARKSVRDGRKFCKFCAHGEIGENVFDAQHAPAVLDINLCGTVFAVHRDALETVAVLW